MLLRRPDLEDLTIVFPDNAGKQIVHELEQIINIYTGDPLTSAEIEIGMDEDESIVHVQSTVTRNRAIDYLPNWPQVALFPSSLTARESPDPGVLRDEELKGWSGIEARQPIRVTAYG